MTFDHAAHVKFAWETLRVQALPEAMITVRDTIRAVAERVGKPEKYHETMTLAFVCLVNERLVDGGAGDWDGFRAANPDLFEWGEGSVLDRYYDRETLSSPLARRTFVLPGDARSGRASSTT